MELASDDEGCGVTATRGTAAPDGGEAAAIIEELRRRGLRLGLAESCTGGGLASALTEPPGASAVFVGAIVAYDNSVKTGLLGVGPETLAEHGAVSEETAREMAEGARRILATDIALSITGIAGPTGGTPEKPVGTVWMGTATAEGASARRFHFDGGRQAVRRESVEAALAILGEILRQEG